MKLKLNLDMVIRFAVIAIIAGIITTAILYNFTDGKF